MILNIFPNIYFTELFFFWKFKQSKKNGLDNRAFLTSCPPCKRARREHRNSLCWTDYWWILTASCSPTPAPSCKRWTPGNSHRMGCHRGIPSRTQSGWDNLIPRHTGDCGTSSVFNSRNYDSFTANPFTYLTEWKLLVVLHNIRWAWTWDSPWASLHKGWVTLGEQLSTLHAAEIILLNP